MAPERWRLGFRATPSTSRPLSAATSCSSTTPWTTPETVELPAHESFFTAYTHYEQNAAQITYRSTWTTVSAGLWSGGSYARSSNSTAAAFVTFTGNVIEVYGPTGPGSRQGAAPSRRRHAVDVDLYSADAEPWLDSDDSPACRAHTC